MRGLLWSHLLASVCGGLILAGVLLGFGVVGKQRTETVPIDYSAAPPTTDGGAGTTNTEQIYLSESPGVVYIRTTLVRRVASPFIHGVEPAAAKATGSGFLISGQGFILTSFHEIEGAATDGITVEFDSDTSRRAEVIRESQADDVALLKVDMKGVPAQIRSLPIGNSRTVGVGDATLAIANPYGLDRTLSSGIVSALQRQLTAADQTSIDNVIQTDTPGSPGASGGPLLDDQGDVIGVNSQIEVSSGGDSFSVDFAIPINTVRQIIPKGVLP
jgi:S1-C subfamily serine protease